ncbi:MAG: hypothetical protein ACLPPV_19755 [Candidatus Korobacteraceae bacterium]
MLRRLGQSTSWSIEAKLIRQSMGWAVTSAIVEVLVCALLILDSGSARAQVRTAVATEPNALPTLVIGFMGGFVHSDDLRHSEAQLAQRLQRSYGDRVTVEMFENRQTAQAHEAIVDWLTRLGDARVTDVGPPPQIVLFGHSWGASAVVYLCRELEREGIRVSLTVQVDSVRKHGEDDSLIPANVAEAANFYQPNGILHGQSMIRAADPSRTTILGNYRFAYQHEPAACHAYPWYTRLLFKGHTAIECDPRVWSRVETMIENRLPITRTPEAAAYSAPVLDIEVIPDFLAL